MNNKNQKIVKKSNLFLIVIIFIQTAFIATLLWQKQSITSDRIQDSIELYQAINNSSVEIDHETGSVSIVYDDVFIEDQVSVTYNAVDTFEVNYTLHYIID